MSAEKDYIRWIRSKVGQEKVILVFAGGCIFNDKGKVLLQRRGDFGKWGFPGGAVELGETPEQAAVREIKEETGLEVEISNLVGIYTDCNMEYPNGDKAQSICIVYEFRVTGGELHCDEKETLELRWFSLNEEPELFCKQHEETWRDIVARNNSSRFFENKQCEYYPCHEGMEEMNCLFCYCPLYALEHCPGKYEYKQIYGKRVKLCDKCTFPHEPENYDKIIQILSGKTC